MITWRNASREVLARLDHTAVRLQTVDREALSDIDSNSLARVIPLRACDHALHRRTLLTAASGEPAACASGFASSRAIPGNQSGDLRQRGVDRHCGWSLSTAESGVYCWLAEMLQPRQSPQNRSTQGRNSPSSAPPTGGRERPRQKRRASRHLAARARHAASRSVERNLPHGLSAACRVLVAFGAAPYGHSISQALEARPMYREVDREFSSPILQACLAARFRSVHRFFDLGPPIGRPAAT